MKTINPLRIILLLALSPLMPSLVQARLGASDLRYKFSIGQTNVYRIEVQVRGETGQDTTSGNVFIVPKEADANVIRLSFRANLETKRGAQRFPFGDFGGMYPGRPLGLTEEAEFQIDNRGHVLSTTGDVQLPIPLGTLMYVLAEQLPDSQAASHWGLTDESNVMDSPQWLGPASGFSNSQAFGSRFFMGFDPRQRMVAALAVSRHVDYRITAVTPETITIHKQISLHSFLKTGLDPRVSSTGGGDLVFDRAAGLFSQIEMQCDTSSTTETTSRKAQVTIKCHLLRGPELASVLAQLAPAKAAQGLKPTPDEMPKLMADLKSADVGTRRSAASRLGNAELDLPSPDLLNLIASLATDADGSIRQSVASFLNNYGTTNEVPSLLKLLKDSDWTAHQTAIKALGRLRDERVIQPLADCVARGNSPGQQEASSALINIGSPAETAVLQMFIERNLETRRQACRILQQIGTTKSIESLQNLVGDPDQSLSQAATEAIRAIKFRE